MKIKLLLILAFGALVFSGCADEAADRPPKFSYGRDLCRECHMIISDPLFSCALPGMGGEVYKFDDIGCMKRFLSAHGTQADNAWVCDQPSGRFIPAPSAWFVSSKELLTPMGSGLAAFFERKDAERFSSEKSGTIFSWTQLPDQPKNDKGE